jgi:hypothetical protein
MDELLKKSVKITLILVMAIAAVLTTMQQWRFAAGLIVASVWSIINFLLLTSLLKISVLRQSKTRLWLILFVKFPVLYLLGYLLLVSKFFPIFSLLAGIASFILITGVLNIWFRRM